VTNANFDMTVAGETATLLGFFQKRSLMSGYLRHVLDANLFDPHQVTKPDWYDSLSKNLSDVKAKGQQWFDVTSVSMTDLAQNYVNFANAFDGQMGKLLPLMTDLIAGTGDADTIVGGIVTIFDDWISQARGEAKSAAASEAAFKSYLTGLSAAITALTQGAASVNTAIAVDKQQVINITADIATLQAQLQTDIKAAIAANSGTLAALIVLIIGIVIVVGSGGTAAIVGAVIAGVGLAGTLVGTIITSIDIVNDQNAIVAKMGELSDENQQVVVLNGIALTVNGLVDTYKDAGVDMSDLVDTWSNLVTNLQQVRDLIIAERTDVQGLKAVLCDIKDFQTTLDALRLYATDLQAAALSVDALPVKTLTPLAALAA